MDRRQGGTIVLRIHEIHKRAVTPRAVGKFGHLRTEPSLPSLIRFKNEETVYVFMLCNYRIGQS